MSTEFDWSQYKSLGSKSAVSNEVASPQENSEFDWNQYETFAQPKEGTVKKGARYATQPLIGAAEFTPYGIATGAWQLLGSAEALKELENFENFREEELRQKFPTAPWPEKPVFDKEKYLQALQQASKLVPTPSNIASFIEKQTGIPLEANTKLQKLLRIGGGASYLKPGGLAEKVTAGVVAPTTTAALERIGVPEPIAEIGGLVTGGVAPTPKFETLAKPSGIPKRMFESLKKETKVSPRQYENIKVKVESDIKDFTNKLIREKNKTAEEIATNPEFRQKLFDELDKVQNIAKEIPGEFSSEPIKRNILEKIKQPLERGISPSEYERAYKNELTKLYKSIPETEESMFKFYEQYRKNNESYKKIYEPGKSTALNDAKKDALREYNKSVEKLFEENLPNSEFNKLFKITNKQYSDLMNFESIEEYFKDVFSKEKINYREAEKFLNNKKVSGNFKSLIGQEGYNELKQGIKDFLSTENGFKLLKTSEAQSYTNLAKLATKFVINKPWGMLSYLKTLPFSIRNELLGSKQFRIKWESALKNFKKGFFNESQKDLNELQNIELKTWEKAKNQAQKIYKEKPTKENKQILDRILEANPEFVEKQYLNEPKTYLRKSDVKGVPPRNSQFTTKEWNKSLNPKLKDKYYNSSLYEKSYLGKIGDIIEDPKLRKSLEDVLDVPVYIDPHLPSGHFGMSKNTFDQDYKVIPAEQVIRIAPDLSPEQLKTTLSHEAIHSLQSKKISKKTGISKIWEREENRPPLSKYASSDEIFDYYIKNLNEVYARKFERWVSRDINKYRSTLEKTKVVKKLLEEQKKKK